MNKNNNITLLMIINLMLMINTLIRICRFFPLKYCKEFVAKNYTSARDQTCNLPGRVSASLKKHCETISYQLLFPDSSRTKLAYSLV